MTSSIYSILNFMNGSNLFPTFSSRTFLSYKTEKPLDVMPAAIRLLKSRGVFSTPGFSLYAEGNPSLFGWSMIPKSVQTRLACFTVKCKLGLDD